MILGAWGTSTRVQRRVSSTIARWPRILAASTNRRVEYKDLLRERMAMTFRRLRGEAVLGEGGARFRRLCFNSAIGERHGSTHRGGAADSNGLARRGGAGYCRAPSDARRPKTAG